MHGKANARQITQAMLAAISQAAELPECKPDPLDVHGANRLDALFFVVGQMCANSADHYHNKGPIIHIHPVGASNKFISGSTHEWTVRVGTEVWFVKTGHKGQTSAKRG
jgi:hypothetical protein